jgi:ribonuclease-3
MDKYEKHFKELQERLGVEFNDVSLLVRAATHRSYINEHPEAVGNDNERLEFLGDAVLDFIAGDWLYHRFPEWREGRLTRLRAALVRTQALASFAIQCGLDRGLLLGRGEEKSGGRSRPSNLCGAFEAFIGAFYIDQGIEAVRDYVEPYFEPVIARILKQQTEKDPRSRLQEWTQAELGTTPRYHTVETIGPEHDKKFKVEVTVGKQVKGKGLGRRKRSAARAAAANAIQSMNLPPDKAEGSAENEAPEAQPETPPESDQ